MAENKQNSNCSENPNSTDIKHQFWMLVIVMCLLVVVPESFFFYFIHTNEATNVHGLKFDEELIAVIDSLESNCNAKDSVQLRQEVGNVKKLTQYLINRETNYQMEIDLIIDKYSQWTGYWLSIIGIVLTLFTIIQVLLNYRMNNQYEKMVKEAKDEYNTTKEKMEKDFQEGKRKIESTLRENIKIFKSSILHNNLSCINACLSTFPDAFSFSPTEERKKFVKTFMNMLLVEYTKFTEYINKLYLSKITKGVYKEETDMPDLSPEVKYVYLVWCDISIAINKASLDYTESKQTVAFEYLKESLSTVIINYHDGKITSSNIVEHMKLIQQYIEEVTHLI